MKSKSIMQGVVGPHILFTSAYLLFSAEVCTSSADHQSRKRINKPSVATHTVQQAHAIKALSHSEDDANDCNQLDAVQDDLAIASEQDDASPDTDTTTPSVKPLVASSEQSVLDQQQEKKASTGFDAVEAKQPNGSGDGEDNSGSYSSVEKKSNTDGTVPPLSQVFVGNNSGPSSNGASDANTHKIDKHNHHGVNKPQSGNSNRVRILEEIQSGHTKLKRTKEQLPKSDIDILLILNQYTNPLHKAMMSDVLEFLFDASKYSFKVRSIALKNFLEASAGTYSHDKVILLRKFFQELSISSWKKGKDSVFDYGCQILQLIINQVTGPDKDLYALETVEKAEELKEACDKYYDSDSDSDSNNNDDGWDDK